MHGNGIEITQNSILRINDKKTMQLIEEYKKEQCLWNTGLEDYPNKEKRIKAADRIAKKLNIPNFGGKHVMIKFKNLRNSYCQELKKIAHSLSIVGSEDSAELYRPKVQWFPLMDSFLRPHLQSSRPAIVSAQLQPEGIVSEVKMEFYESDGQDDWAIPMKERPDTNYAFSEQFNSENDELSNDSRTKRRRLSRSNRSGEHSQNQICPPGDSSDPAPPNADDTFDNFGRYIASLLRSLTPEQALRLQPKIINMIVDVGISEVGRVNVKIERIDSDRVESD